MEKTYITETQSFKFLIIIPAIFSVLLGVLCYFQLVLHRPMGNHPAPNAVLVLFFILSFGGIYFFISQKLICTITDKAVYVSFGILTSAQIFLLTDIKSITVRKYDGLGEFMGWGVRYSANEDCYTVSGSYGIEIEVDNRHSKILIGTQKPEEMQAVISKYLAVS